MELEGTIHDGVAVPDGECPLPEGTKVKITEATAPPIRVFTLSERLLQLAAECEKTPCDLPTDLSLNHDHYLYGLPKRES